MLKRSWAVPGGFFLVSVCADSHHAASHGCWGEGRCWPRSSPELITTTPSQGPSDVAHGLNLQCTWWWWTNRSPEGSSWGNHWIQSRSWVLLWVSVLCKVQGTIQLQAWWINHPRSPCWVLPGNGKAYLQHYPHPVLPPCFPHCAPCCAWRIGLRLNYHLGPWFSAPCNS